MGYHSSKRPCLPRLLPAALTQRLHECSVCGETVILDFPSRSSSMPPAFPDRSRSVLCKAPPTNAYIYEQYGDALRRLQQSEMHKCLGEIEGNAAVVHFNPFARDLRDGPPSRLRDVCLIDGHRQSYSIEEGSMRAGDKHMVASITSSGDGATSEEPAAIVRMHWPKGQRPKPPWHYPRPTRCQLRGASKSREGVPEMPSHRLVCESKEEEREFWERCSMRLRADSDNSNRAKYWGVLGANPVLQDALRGLPGWPSLLGGGCCAYKVSDGEVIAVPVEIRRRQAISAGRLLSDALSPDCVRHGWARDACLLYRVLRSIELLAVLTEEHHLVLAEHIHVPNRSASGRSSCGELNLENAQFCTDAESGALALCDTDFIGPPLLKERPAGHEAEPPSVQRPLSFSTTVSTIHWADFKAIGGRPPAHGLLDLPCALANTMLAPLGSRIPQLALAADEIFERHEAIVEAAAAGDGKMDNVRQLSLSCLHAWLRSAVPRRLVAAITLDR